MTTHIPNNKALITLGRVSYAYPTHLNTPALTDIDLDVRPGEYLLVCGASGSGKSSLVRTFNGLIPHFYSGHLTGTVTVAGRATADTVVADLFDKVGMVFQNPKAQLFNLTVAQEIIFGMESLGLDRIEMQRRLETVSREMKLESMLARNPQSLSGGEQQWVAIAALLALQPHCIVLDEPMANLDAAHIQRLKQLLIQLRSRGVGIVVCEHRMVPTLPHADQVMVIQNGGCLLRGPADKAAAHRHWPENDIELPLAIGLGRKLGLHPLPRSLDDLAGFRHLWADTDAPDTPDINVSKSTPAGQPLVTLEKVSYRFKGNPVVKDISFALYPGQCTALVGANGAGKTTLIKLINGLLKPDAGCITVAGQPAARLHPWQLAGTIGTAFQNPNSQFFKLTVKEEILVGPRALNCLDENWINELTEIFKLGHLLDRAPFKLSGGEKKRVAFAAALAAKPKVLVLDEPTAGQDSGFRLALIQCLHNLTRQGAAVLVVTHALNFLESLTQRWLIMAGGKLIADAAPHEIMSDVDLMQKAGLVPTEAFQWKQCLANR